MMFLYPNFFDQSIYDLVLILLLSVCYSTCATSSLKLVDNFAGCLCNANLLVAIHLEANAGSFALYNKHNVGCIDVSFLVYDAALLVCMLTALCALLPC